jgi:hypothetical protein
MTSTEVADSNSKIEKEVATYNTDQRRQIVKLADTLKETIAESENKDFKGKCETCLEMLRSFSKNNKVNPCNILNLVEIS